jgi:integrase/recombinase XerC
MGIVKRDPAHPLQGPKKEKALPVFIKEQEADKLFDELQWDMDKIKDVRARTLLLLLYSTGIRRAEVIALRDSDVNLVSREIKVTGKRRKQRIIPLGDEIVTELQHYMALRDREQPGSEDTSNGALFRNDSGKALTEDNVYSTVRTYLTQVTTQKKRSPHVLRHSFATAMLNNDAQLGSVQKLLGHQSLTTTQIYTHVTFKDLKRTYSMAHPRESRK